MKKQIRIAFIITTLLAALTFTLAGEIRDVVFSRLLRLTAQEVISPKFIAEAFKSGPDYGSDKVSFHNGYHQARSTTYDLTFWGEGHSDVDHSTYDSYYSLRTVMVASMKRQLHSGTTLVDIYKSRRQDFIKFLGEEKPRFRQALLNSVDEAIKVFGDVKKPEFRKELQDLALSESRTSYGFNNDKVEEMLAKHVKAEDIVRQIQRQQKEDFGLKSVVPAEKTRDRDLEKFALRRYYEGGEKLVNKYIELTRLVREDVKGTITSTP